MKCPECKSEMRDFGSILNLGSNFWCEDKKCKFYHIKRYIIKKETGGRK